MAVWTAMKKAEAGLLQGSSPSRDSAGIGHMEVLIEGEDQSRRACRVDLPLADHDGRRSGHKEGPAQTDKPLAGANSASRRFAAGKHHKFGAQIQTHHLA